MTTKRVGPYCLRILYLSLLVLPLWSGLVRLQIARIISNGYRVTKNKPLSHSFKEGRLFQAELVAKLFKWHPRISCQFTEHKV